MVNDLDTIEYNPNSTSFFSYYIPHSPHNHLKEELSEVFEMYFTILLTIWNVFDNKIGEKQVQHAKLSQVS